MVPDRAAAAKRASFARGGAAALFAALLLVLPATLLAAEPQAAIEAAWWAWVLLLFVFSFVLGIFAVLAGVGGGVLFVPIVSSFFPFHLDFVRGAGLMVALSVAISAGSPLMRKGLADLKLGLPMALVGSLSSIAGAMVGLALPAQTVQLLLGIVIVVIASIMFLSGKSGYPEVKVPDALSKALHISGIYYEESIKKRSVMAGAPHAPQPDILPHDRFYRRHVRPR